MIGYVILGIFILLVIICTVFFFIGLRHGRKLANAEYAEDMARREKDEKDYRKVKQDIQQEVFKDAEQQKAGLSGHSSGIDRFNDVNSKLSKRAPKN
jgi:F420-0:gamma-glutamyl ligase